MGQIKPGKSIGNPFAKKKNKNGNKDDRLITFAQIIETIRSHVGWVYLLVLAVVLFVELPLRSQAIHDNQTGYVWIAAVLTGFLFYRIAVWHSPISILSRLEIGKPLRWREISLGLVGGVVSFGWLYLLDRLFLKFVYTYYVGMFQNSWPYHGGFVILALLAGGLVRPIFRRNPVSRYIFTGN